MAVVTRVLRRVLLGGPTVTDRVLHPAQAKRLAMPILGSKPVSSVAYAPQEIMVALAAAGAVLVGATGWVALGVLALFAGVVFAYRRLISEYPQGGDHEAAARNLGWAGGAIVGSALLVGHVLAVAVAVSVAADSVISADLSLAPQRLWLALGLLALLALVNMHTLRETGWPLALPTYLFLGGVAVMVLSGLYSAAVGDAPVAETAGYTVLPSHGMEAAGAFALALVVVRAFVSGSALLAGIEAIPNRVPGFETPRKRNADRALVILGAACIAAFVGVVVLALISDVRVHSDPCRLDGLVDCEDSTPRTVLAQLASAVFGGPSSVGFWFVQVTTVLVLLVAGNTAFHSFQVLGGRLAQAESLPRQLRTQGDRTVHRRSTVLVGLAAAGMVWWFDGDVTRLITVYVLSSATCIAVGQLGMAVHSSRAAAEATERDVRRRHQRDRVVSAATAAAVGLVVAGIVVTRFGDGVVVGVLAMALLYLMQDRIRQYYHRVTSELSLRDSGIVLPARTHVVVLVSKLERPALRALAYARAGRPASLTALTVNIDETETRRLQSEWERHDIPVRLTVLEAPVREITAPVIDYVRGLRANNPSDVVNVLVPEYVVGRWWEQFLHNQSAVRLKRRLLFQPGVMVTSVPWQMESSGEGKGEPARPAGRSATQARPAGEEPPKGRAASVEDTDPVARG